MKAIFDLEKVEFTLQEEKEGSPFGLDLKFCFKEGDKKEIIFDNLNFGFQLYEGQNKLAEDNFPKEGFTYYSTDQEVLEISFVVDLLPDITYTLVLWCNNGSNKIQATFPVIRPRPPKPVFNSWVYNEAEYRWDPPVPWPDPDTPGYAKWDEENLQFIFVDTIEELEQ